MLGFLFDPDVIEIMLNPDGKIWIDRLSSGQEMTNEIMRADRALFFLNTVADSLNVVFNDEKSTLQGELVIDGSRIQGERAPTVSNPSFNIRKRAQKVYTLEEYVSDGRITQEDADYITLCVKNRHNILVVGSTGSGKTTLTNAIIDTISREAPRDRLVIIEDTVELQCRQENAVAMRTNNYVDMKTLVRVSMRKRPERIIIGEIRGAESLDLLKAWNTGHPGGITTVHANSAKEGLTRLESLLLEAVPQPMERLIGEAVDTIIFITRTEIGPKVTEILNVNSFNPLKKDYEIQWVKKPEKSS